MKLSKTEPNNMLSNASFHSKIKIALSRSSIQIRSNVISFLTKFKLTKKLSNFEHPHMVNNKVCLNNV